MAGRRSKQPPQAIEAAALRQSPTARRDAASATYGAAASGDYAVQFARYPMVDAYVGKWNEGSPHILLLEYINAPDFMGLFARSPPFPNW